MRAAIVVGLAVVALGRAHADPQPSESDKLFDEGRKLLEAGDAQGACDKFDKAIRLDPTGGSAAGTMLNLGLCNEKLEKYASALYWFRKAQTAAAEAKLGPQEQVAKQHTIDLASKVATIVIAVNGADPATAKVKIDRVEVKPEDFSHAEVDPGHHVLEAGAPKMKNVHQEFDVTGKGGQTLTVTFVAGSNAVVIDHGKGRRRAAIYTAIGAGGLFLADGIVAIYAKSRYGNKDDPKTNAGMAMLGIGGTGPGSPYQKANDARHLAATWGTGLFIAGSVAIAAAAILYFTAPQPEKLEQTVFVPTVDPDGAGFAVAGHF